MLNDEQVEKFKLWIYLDEEEIDIKIKEDAPEEIKEEFEKVVIEIKRQGGWLEDFYKKNETDQIWRTAYIGRVGEILFSFDKKRIYNFFLDYPHELTQEQKEIFDKENPELAKLK